MNKTKIEWCDYTINPVKGLCPMACPYCYARRMYKRFKWNPELYLETSVFADLPEKPSKIFIGSTMELFGEWIKAEWLNYIFDSISNFPQHTFIFLTKRLEGLIRWSPFPDNCWVGVSTIGNDCNSSLEDIFVPIQARVKFVSIEPLLDYTSMDFSWVDWVIIGAQTPVSVKNSPKVEWIREIVEAADKSAIPVFLKDNLEGLFGYPLPQWAEDKIMNTRLRQEFPNA